VAPKRTSLLHLIATSQKNVSASRDTAFCLAYSCGCISCLFYFGKEDLYRLLLKLNVNCSRSGTRESSRSAPFTFHFEYRLKKNKK
jgi:hypothetical protein